MTRILLIAVAAGALTTAAAEVQLQQGDNRIDVTIDGQPFTTFYYGPNTAKPFLWPLRTATGLAITRQWPIVKDVAGESHDHPHQRGLWFSHGNVNGSDFWANEPEAQGKQKGVMKLVRIVSAKSGAKSGTIDAIFDWFDHNGKKLLTENRTMTFYDDPINRVIDFDIRLKADRNVTFGDTKEGTFAMRLADEMTEKHGGTLVNAQGAQKMQNVWGKQSNWVDYSGVVGKDAVGVAIFDNPQNPRHPTYWHARDYGLFAANPFGVRDFTEDKSRDGSMTLKKGNEVEFRYRVVIHPGNAQLGDVAKLYDAYTQGKLR